MLLLIGMRLTRRQEKPKAKKSEAKAREVPLLNEDQRRVGENRTNTVGFPCPYPPFPAACPFRFPVVLADPLPSQIPPCGFPPVGSSGTIRRSSPRTTQ